MSKPRLPTRRIRVRLDFVVVLPREVSSLPFGGVDDIHPVLVGAADAVIDRLREGTVSEGEMVELARGGRMSVSLDNRRAKKEPT